MNTDEHGLLNVCRNAIHRARAPFDQNEGVSKTRSYKCEMPFFKGLRIESADRFLDAAQRGL
jgi:hypothetical protein